MHNALQLPVISLPRHARQQPRFDEMFCRPPHAAIAAMDAAGDDIPNQRPRHPIVLQRIGLSRTSIPVTVQDPFTPGDVSQLACSVDVSVPLDARRRGIHVSRIGDALARLSQELFPSLQHYADALCEQIAMGQHTESAEVHVEGVLSYLEPSAGTSKASLEHLRLRAGAACETGSRLLSAGVGFNHITACPCVQQTCKHAFDNPQRTAPQASAKPDIPFLTHSQRCFTELTIAGLATPIPLPELLACIDRIVVRCRNTLPREHELLTVLRAHLHPQFLEDVLRDLLAAVYHLLKSDNAASVITIRSTSMESIHDFDLCGEIMCSVAELTRLLDGDGQPRVLRPRPA